MSAETWWKSWRRNEVTEKHTCCWQNCSVRSECLSIVPSPLSLPSLPLLGCVCVCVCGCVCVVFCLSCPRNHPGLTELCVAHQVRLSERTLMCDFPSTYRPKWIGTSAIIFCHYSFQARHCVEIQTILAVWSKKRGRKKRGRKREKRVRLWQQ